MRDHRLHHSIFEWLCACLMLAPCAALAQQPVPAQQSSSAPRPAAASTEGKAPSSSPSAEAAAAGPANTAPASDAHARSAPRQDAEDVEPAVDTSAETAHARNERRDDTKQKATARASGKAMDHLELGTTDITGNRELPKVMYIVPWKRSDLGDLTGKPLNSLVNQTLEPVDRNVFERANRYYGAVTGAAAQDVHRTPDAGSGSPVRDEK